MNWNSSTLESMRRVFAESFAARDVTEPLISFDAGDSAVKVGEVMDKREFDAVGVRNEGVIVGYVERSDLNGTICGEKTRSFAEAIVLSDDASLSDVVLGLNEKPRIFVRAFGGVCGIITMSDLHKPPMRMWIFGMLTLMEMRTNRLIQLTCPGDSWKEYLSESRLELAEKLLAERRRRNQNLDFLDCLQVADKGQIIAKHEELRRMAQVPSRTQAEQHIKSLESLRNNLAHSQDVIPGDWDTIVNLCKDLERVVHGTEEVKRAIAEPD